MELTRLKGLTAAADELEKKVAERLPSLAPMFKQCFLNTIQTTVQQLDDGSYFVITGDIPAMWLRDSAAQVRPYLKYAPSDPVLQEVIKSIVQKHEFYVTLDPYSNAFNAKEKENEHGYVDQSDFQSKWIWERKYEVDSLCASVYLAYEYYSYTEDKSILDDKLAKMLHAIADTFILEQRHENSSYFFKRINCSKTDTISFGGKGRPVNFTGMTWSGFRPSDDACEYNYLIPSNMMAVVAMKYAAKLAELLKDKELEEKCLTLADEIEDGIEHYGTYIHPKYGRIYAYETDGFGNHILMDDANSPSLLSIPYIGYRSREDETYKNTRRFILSKDNPFYYEGSVAKGIGSPHTPPNYIWHISLVMQILTSSDEKEIFECIETLSKTHAGTNFMHEGFDVNNPNNFTREWFAWANTLFAQMVEALVRD